MFRDITKNYTISVLDKSGKTPVFKMGQVVNISPARYEQKPAVGGMQMPMERVIDLTLEIDGQTMTFVVPENGNVASNQGYTLACDNTFIANEVRAMHRKSMEAIANITFEEENAKACEAILNELNPSYTDTKVQNERLDKLEASLSKMGSVIENIEKVLTSSSKRKNHELE